MQGNQIQVLPYVTLSNNAMVVSIIVIVAVVVTLGLVLSHRRKLKQDEQDHVATMADITKGGKSV